MSTSPPPPSKASPASASPSTSPVDPQPSQTLTILTSEPSHLTTATSHTPPKSSSQPSTPLAPHRSPTRFKPAHHKTSSSGPRKPPSTKSQSPITASPSQPIVQATLTSVPEAAKQDDDVGWDNEEGFGGYMRHKNRKLREQFDKQYSAAPKSSVMKGVVIWVDGHTTPSRLALRDIIGRHGGRLETYFSTKLVTHVVAENLATATRKRFAEMKRADVRIVTPKWITDSIEQGKMLPERLYTVKGMTDPMQRSIASMFKSKTKRKT